MPCSVTTRSASARGVVTTPSASFATMRERVRSRLVDCSAMIDRPSAARLAARDEIHLAADKADMPSPCGLGIDLAGEVDLERAIDRDEAAEIAEHQRVMGVRRRADLDRRVAVGEAVEPRGSHQHRRHGDGGVDLLVPVVDDAGLHQIGDPVSDRSRMDAETLFAAERAGYGLGNSAEAKLDRRAIGDQSGDVIGDGAVDRPCRPRRQLDRRRGGRHQHVDRRRLDRRVTIGPRQFRVDLRDDQPRPADRRVQMLDAEPGIVPPRFVRTADLQQHDVDRQAATGYQAADIGNIGRHDVVGAAGEKPPPGAGAAQCGDGDVGVAGAKAVAECQREKHAEWRAALRLGIEQAGEEYRFRRRLSPADCLAGADQLGKIERFGRYCDRGFHAPLSAAISPGARAGLPRTARSRRAERP